GVVAVMSSSRLMSIATPGAVCLSHLDPVGGESSPAWAADPAGARKFERRRSTFEHEVSRARCPTRGETTQFEAPAHLPASHAKARYRACVTDPATSAPAPSKSEVEARFDRLRARVGAVLAPLVLFGLLLAPMPGLEAPAHRLVAIAAMTVVLWISEAIPLAVSALLAPALAVMLDVAPAGRVFAPFAHPLIFMFIGGFMLAEALSVHGFDRRAALWLLA